MSRPVIGFHSLGRGEEGLKVLFWKTGVCAYLNRKMGMENNTRDILY